MLSVPTELYNLNPLWKTCLPGISAFYDPQYALSTANGLTIPSITHGGNPIIPVATATGESAVAGPTGTPPTASSTKTPTPSSTLISTPQGKPAPTRSSEPSQTAVIDPPKGLSSSLSTILPELSLDGTTATANSASAIIIASQTLTPGGQVTVSGTIISMTIDGSSVIFGGSSTQVLVQPASQQGTSAVFTQAQPQITPAYLVGSQTLVASGSTITVSSTVLSLAVDRSSVVIGTSTEALSGYLSSNPAVTKGYQIGTQILADGGLAITISGIRLSLADGRSSIVVGTQTEALGDYISSNPSIVGGVRT
jgi:hypothetical protein